MRLTFSLYVAFAIYEICSSTPLSDVIPGGNPLDVSVDDTDIEFLITPPGLPETATGSQDSEKLFLLEDSKFQYLSRLHRSKCSKHQSCHIMDTLTTDKKFDCCGSCTCDSECFRHGSCCLGVYNNLTHAKDSITNTRYDCARAQYLPPSETTYNTDRFYWMVSRCDPAYKTDISEQNSCEMPVQTDIVPTLDTITPVTDLLTGIHYKNIFCAYCNSVDDYSSLIKWKLHVQSERYLFTNGERFLELLKEDKGNIIYVSPGYIAVQTCDVPAYTISSCNETGLWSFYEETIEEGCESLVDPFNSTYKNIFCFLCNGGKLIENGTCSKRNSDLVIKTPPFFAIFDVDIVKGASNKKLQCTNTQFVDEIIMVCHDVLCHEDRSLDEGECLVSKLKLKTSCYIIFYDIKPEGYSVHFNDIANSRFREVVKNTIFSNKSDDIHSNMILFYHTDSDKHVEKVIALVWLLNTRDSNKVMLIDYIGQLKNKHGQNMFFYPEPKKADYYLKFRFEGTVYNYSFEEPASDNYPLHRGGAKVNIDISDDVVNHLKADLDRVLLSTCTGNTTVINKLYYCPFIEVSRFNISYWLENDILFLDGYGGLTMTVNETPIVLSRWSYEIDGDAIRFCLEDFIKLFYSMSRSMNLKDKELNKEANDAKDTLSLTCICFSIACLLVTILTYCLMPVLQSNPGINNLILCIFLLLAQAIYQFGTAQTGMPYIICVIIGVVCHFLWLCVVFSMNMCSIQMFIIFKKAIKITPHFDLTQTIRGIMYVLGMSLFFVIVNMVTSLLKSNGTDNGYGGEHICYISSSLMQSVTFVIPSGLSILINIILFCNVVYKIRRIGEASVRINKERRYLGVYARLSTLTGVTWIFGYLRILLDHEFLEYLFIIFNASQGIFIMIAFVLNRRVFRLLCGKKVPSSVVTQIEIFGPHQQRLKA